MKRTITIVTAALVLAACGTSAAVSDGGTGTIAVATTSTTGVTTSAPPVTAAPTTPRPDAATGASIESQVAAIYPGVPAGKSADWAVSLCRDILAADPAVDLVERTARQFEGGDRPALTIEQATAILDAVRNAGFCTA